MRPFGALARIVTSPRAGRSPSLPSSSRLEQLYLGACALQATGDLACHAFIVSIFLACLRTYLRPLRLWMETGAVPPTGDFIVVQAPPNADTDADADLGSFWHRRFRLRRSAHGSLLAPPFVHPVADLILTTGKSVAFLQLLDPSSSSSPSPSSAAAAAASVPDAADIAFEDVCVPGSSALAPFSSLFLAAFNRWISARHHCVSARLREQLFARSGLWRALGALELVFLARNGFLFESLAQGIFEKLDSRAAAWRDRFLLTEHIQTVFAPVPEVDAARLRMRVVAAAGPASRATKDAAGRKTVDALANIEVDYRLPWPVLNIVRSDSLATYRRVFTFLLQLRRARYLLERLRLGPAATAATSTTAATTTKIFYSLKQRLLWFSGVVVAYITDQVLRPLTARLRVDLEAAVDVDGMVATHAAFIARVREQCLLGAKLMPIHGAVLSVLNLAVRFCRLHAALHDPPDGPAAAAPRRRARPCYASSDDEADDGDGGDDDDDDGDAGSRPASPTSSATTGMTTVLGGRQDVGDDGIGDDRARDGEGGAGERRHTRRLHAIRDELRGLVGFITDGLRGVARAGVMPHLDMLADALDGYACGNGPR